jgi:hypothetical protein
MRKSVLQTTRDAVIFMPYSYDAPNMIPQPLSQLAVSIITTHGQILCVTMEGRPERPFAQHDPALPVRLKYMTIFSIFKILSASGGPALHLGSPLLLVVSRHSGAISLHVKARSPTSNCSKAMSPGPRERWMSAPSFVHHQDSKQFAQGASPIDVHA